MSDSGIRVSAEAYAKQSWRQRIDAWPVMMCGMRPFFLFTIFSALAFVGFWLLFSLGGGGLAGWLVAVPGGPIVWHVQELLFGFAFAAIAGFLLVSVPEFTNSQPVATRTTLQLVIVWLLARIVMVLSAWLPHAVAVMALAVSNLGLTVGLLAVVAPRMCRSAGAAHRSFLYALLLLLGLQLGYFIALYRHAQALPWLYAFVGALMVLVLMAAGRVSMRILNSRIQQGVLHEAHADAPVYLARPPRRNFAISAILLCSALEWGHVPAPIIGWVALATAAALLNILNDWHVGRPLYNRWALMLYACYWCLALGYGLMGFSWLGAPWGLSAGRHLLVIGAMSLSVFAVITIAGRQHCGYWLDTRSWLPCAALALLMAAVVRAAAGVFPEYYRLGIGFAGALWLFAFGALGLYMWRVLVGPRPDTQTGCAEPEGEPQHGPGGGCA